jgi:hypothetical protein
MVNAATIASYYGFAAAIAGASDDGLSTLYDRDLGTAPGHIQHNGLTRTGVRFDTAGLGISVKSVWVRFRKYGNPMGNITVNIRKGSDDSIAATIGTFPIQSLGTGGEQSFVVRNKFNNSYLMVANDFVSIEFPSSATDGFELSTTTTQGLPTGYTGRQYNGTTYANTTNPPAITIKG